MKKLAYFLSLGFFALATISLPQEPCAWAAGTWVDNYGNTWSLVQDQLGGITGAASPSGPCTQTYTVSGGYGFNTLNITANHPNPGTGDPDCVDWVNYAGSIGRPGCHTGNGGWANSAGDSGSWNWAKPCEIPSGEIISSGEWREPDLPTVHLWNQTLSPASIDFGGRRVNEEDPGGGSDGCWYDGSPYPRLDRVTGAPPPGWWDVTSPSRWGPDGVGYFPELVVWYRNQRPAQGLPLPCSSSVPQRMVVDCATVWQTYDLLNLTAVIDVQTVESRRGSNTVSRIWP